MNIEPGSISPGTTIPKATMQFPRQESTGPESEERALVNYLHDHEAICPLCKYNLRALTVPRCPECGQSLRLMVGLAEPYLKVWVILTVILCAGAGMGVIAGYALIREWGMPSMSGKGDYYAFMAFIACVPLAGLALAMRRRIIRADRKVQWVMALLAFIFVVSAYTGIIINW